MSEKLQNPVYLAMPVFPYIVSTVIQLVKPCLNVEICKSVFFLSNWRSTEREMQYMLYTLDDSANPSPSPPPCPSSHKLW